MADFNTLRLQLNKLTLDLEQQQRALLLARQRLELLALDQARVVRGRGSDSDAHRTLVAQAQEAQRAVEKNKKALAGIEAARDRVRVDFEAFVDPRKQLAELPNDAPILLFPVRLETRFKIVNATGAAPKHQLWVRVFPDECSIDTFDDVLSQSEIVRARHYWTGLWEAGSAGHAGVEHAVRVERIGAWRELMGVFNAGRAYWITEHYRPLNEADIPVRAAESDRFFVIPTDEPPATAVAAALGGYWVAMFKARGARAASDAALTALVAALGGDQALAQSLVARYVPQSFEPAPADGSPLPTVRVVFQAFAKDAEAKLHPWSQAAKVRTFPERFVLLGFQGNAEPPVVNVIGQPIPDPLIVGPDTRDDIDAVLEQAFPGQMAGLSDDEKAAKYVEYLAQHSETAWLFDFDRAVASGLGFRVDLTAAQYDRGFTRLMVLGIKVGADGAAGQKALEQLFRNHQFGDAGFSLVPQGTATNNTEEGGSGRSQWEDPEEAYARYHEPSTELDPTAPALKRDGRHLADWLGIEPEAAGLVTAQSYYGRDQLEARAMHSALWNATLGYFLESMVAPLATDHQRNVVRSHMIEHVRGRGTVPAIRIGKQPYGILPIANLKSAEWLGQGLRGIDPDDLPTLRKVFDGLRVMRADLEAEVLGQVAHVGGTGDAHAILLRVIGLEPGSVEFDRRLAEGLASIKSALTAQGVLGDEIADLGEVYRAEGMALLQRLGYRPDDASASVAILERSFLGKQEDIDKPLIDDTPLSEQRAVRAYTDTNENYIEWLIRAAKEDHKLIRDQQGFSNGRRPVATLYDLLVHAMNLGFADASLDLHLRADVIQAHDVRDMRRDQEFIAVQADNPLIESKWDLMYREEPHVAPAGTTIAEHIAAQLRGGIANASTQQLEEVLDALEVLKRAPTARLERCLVEHLDCCHYRLDAWLLSFLRLRLAALRFAGEGGEGELRRGVYLGAYGWVEDLEPDDKGLLPAPLDDTQRAVFDPDGQGDVVTDTTNAGYVHGLSVGHGITAAVLRNAYISSASPEDAERYKVNLSSERVRAALAILEGMQQGQSLAELLGYELERGLHDNNDEELDIFVYELRKVFPLVSNRLKRTAIGKGRVGTNALELARFAEEEAELKGDRAFSKVEARNVVNGLALLERVKTPGQAFYPFGFPTGTGPGELRGATDDERAAIDAEVRRIANIEDAVADLALAEGVHQVVQGNYERAAGALDAYSKGGFPPLPDVVQSPASGLGLTHRFGIHLQAGVSPDAGLTPRSKTEPAINAWLEDLFPPANLIACKVLSRLPVAEGEAPNAWDEFPVTLASLQLEPIDLLYVHDRSSEKNLGALDDHVLRHFQAATPRRPDLEIMLDYTSSVPNGVSFFELGAMLAELRTLVISARPLEASDLTLQTAGTKSQNTSASIHPDRIIKARAMLDVAIAGLQTVFIDVFEPLVDFEDPSVGRGNFTSIRNQIDASSDQLVLRLGELSLFGMQGAASSSVYERRRDIHAALRRKVAAFGERWADYDARYTELLTVRFPVAVDDEARISILHQAEALISATATTAFADVAALQAAVGVKKGAFDIKRAGITAFLGAGPSTFLTSFSAAAALTAGMDAFDLQPLEITDEQNLLVVFVEDLLKQTLLLHAAGLKQSTEAGAQVTVASTAGPVEQLAALKKAAALLFGEAFRVLPEFTLGTEQAFELAQCAGSVDQLLDYQRTTLRHDFPVDDWLYGVARVREKLAAWENLAVLAEAFRDRPPLDLTPFQLPYRDADTWLALAFPETRTPSGDNLLYTAFAAGFDASSRQVGILVDEWTETIPSPQETTALTFHYDRPNCEPPQSLLLVTPSSTTGRWAFQEVVTALHEGLALARVRALEPDLLDKTAYARFLPATVATLTVHPVTIALNYAAQTFSAVVPTDG